MLALALLALQPPDIELRYEQYRGLTVQVGGVPLVERSAFQYYEQGWKRGIYSSNWRPQEVRKLRNGDWRATFNGINGKVYGNVSVRRTPTGFRTEYEFGWRGSTAVYIENSMAMMWAPAFLEGPISVDGFDLGRIQSIPKANWGVTDRQIGSPGSSFTFDSPVAKVDVKVSPSPALLFDARNYGQDWALGRELLWLGVQSRRIEPNSTVRYEMDWTIEPKNRIEPIDPILRVKPVVRPLQAAAEPETVQIPLIPKPKSVKEVRGGIVRIGPSFEYTMPAAYQALAGEFEQLLWSHWLKDATALGAETIPIQADVRDLGMPAEGYDLRIEKGGVTVLGQDVAGLRNGFRTLAMAAQARDGWLIFPQMEVRDWPSISWRGIHTLIGPQALEFQTRLMQNVLGPLKFNRVVLQCERTNWKAIPGTEVGITTSREDLAELGARYRSIGMEPVPLIQSLGHMEWFFDNGQNLDLAVNPRIPYTIDPAKKRSREVLEAIWDEAIDLLKPDTIHLGLDEIDKRGMDHDPARSTALWRQHVPWLMEYARRKKVKAMAWGDMMLGPGEALDAALGDSAADAAARRAALSPGTLVADWHYIDDPMPEKYRSLELWKSLGHVPIASSWYKPNNIRGHNLAAARIGAGSLQTTWAGFASNEFNMVREFRQFSAYVLAGDYSWSGRTEMPTQLGYDPEKVAARLFFSPPSPIRVMAGRSVVVGETERLRTIGNVRAALFKPLSFRSAIHAGMELAPDQIVIPVGDSAREVALIVDCRAGINEGEVVGEVATILDDGTQISRDLIYGKDVRAPTDRRDTLATPRVDGLSAVRILVGDGMSSRKVRELRIRSSSSAAGLRIHGVTLL